MHPSPPDETGPAGGYVEPAHSAHAFRTHGHPNGTPWEAAVSWAAIFEHQKQRQPLIEEWLDWLELGPGDHLVDLGAGPGLTSLLAARRVQPHGRVYAVDHWPEALAFLRQQVEREGVHNVQDVQADIGRDELAEIITPHLARKAVLAHVLHHTRDPEGVLGRLYRWLQPGARMVVAEFDPDGAGRVGPPRAERIPGAALAAWLTAAGFTVVRRKSYPEQEQYAILVEHP